MYIPVTFFGRQQVNLASPLSGAGTGTGTGNCLRVRACRDLPCAAEAPPITFPIARQCSPITINFADDAVVSRNQ
jgi:hypothetical protein